MSAEETLAEVRARLGDESIRQLPNGTFTRFSDEELRAHDLEFIKESSRRSAAGRGRTDPEILRRSLFERRLMLRESEEMLAAGKGERWTRERDAHREAIADIERELGE